MIALKKKPTSAKCSDHRTIRLITHTTKIVGYLEEGLKGKLRMHFDKISFDLEEEKELGMQLG
jgi:hypothetical protein